VGVGGPVRVDHAAVGEKFTRVVEEENAVAQQAPPLLGVKRHGVRGVPVGGFCRWAMGLVRAHGTRLSGDLGLFLFSIKCRLVNPNLKACGLTVVEMTRSGGHMGRKVKLAGPYG
jgi:hypothetical protein